MTNFAATPANTTEEGSLTWDERPVIRQTPVAPEHSSRPRAGEYPKCGRCPSCHPGKQWGGDEKCRLGAHRYLCACHKDA